MFRTFLVSMAVVLALISTVQAAGLDVRYLLVDLTHPSWPAMETILSNRHKEIRPTGHVMSIARSDDGTRGVVKIIGATQQWVSDNGLLNHPAILELKEDNESYKVLHRTHPDWANMRTFQ